MTVYPVVGSYNVWTGYGAANSARRLATVAIPGSNSQSLNVAIPLNLTLLGETTKRGVRRVVLKIEGKMDGEWYVGKTYGSSPGARAGVTGEIPVSAHLVVQLPQQNMQLEQGAWGASALLGVILRELFAVATGASLTSTQAAAMDSVATGVLASALAGSTNLNVDSGTYGEPNRA